MLNIVEGAYLADILAQPAVLDETVATLGDSGAATARKLASGGFRRVILTGMGSSFHALYPLYLRLVSAGFDVIYSDAAELCLYMPAVLTPDVLVIAVSQSGRSAEILSLLEMAGGNVPILAITNDPESPLARSASEVMLIRAGREATVSCKTYVTTLVALEMLAAQIFPADAQATSKALGGAATLVGSYLHDWRNHVEAMAALLEGKQRIFVTGRGRSLAAAGTAGLIIKEATRIAAEGMGSAAFRHGPFETLGGNVLLTALTGDDPAGAALNQRLVQDARIAGGAAELVGSTASARGFILPITHPAVTPIMEILPFQLLSLAIAGLRGEEAGLFRLASKITAIA